MSSPFLALKNATLAFLPTDPVVSGRGGVQMVAGDSELVDARVEYKAVREILPDGTPLTTTFVVVYLFDDPAPLNGGLGIRQDDRFLDGDTTLIASGPPKLHKADVYSLWRVDCMAAE